MSGLQWQKSLRSKDQYIQCLSDNEQILLSPHQCKEKLYRVKSCAKHTATMELTISVGSQNKNLWKV